MLSPYRVLDLTDEKGFFCGKLLGDLGAEVIKIERPDGDPARNIGPFYHDEVDPEKSLFWFAFNTNKKGITLDIETNDGKEIFKRLVKSADFLIESFPPGYMEKLGLNYSALEKINPGIIMVSITPFGQTGPYKNYKAPDIVAWAMGGEMYISGNSDRPPIRISHHSHAYIHAGSEAAVGALAALHYRHMTGEGQQIDVSIEEVVTRVSHQATTIPYDTNGMIARRGGQMPGATRPVKNQWECKDGYIFFMFWGGVLGNRYNMPLIKWMKEEGYEVSYLEEKDWLYFNWGVATDEEFDKIAGPTSAFFMTHTKAELLDGAVRHNFPLYPTDTTADTIKNVQLNARGFWVDVEHPELGTTIKYPGAFVNASEMPPKIKFRAPLIGEHNRQIYQQELGVPEEELLILKQAGVI
jgi:benzylsuccinate CoA-transferase BbsE subunit